MMVLPVQAGGKGKGGKKGGFPAGKKGKKGKHGPGMPGDLQVNLIVDPNAFGGPDVSSSSEEEEDIDDGGMPGAFFSKGEGGDTGKDKDKARRKRKRQKRRSLATALALEEDWKFARGWVRKQAFIDGFAFVLWAVAFGFVMAGKRCPTGGKEQGYGGW